MNPGDLRERVTITSPTATPDSQGGRSIAWGTLATVSANVAPLSANEALAARAVGSQATYAVTIRYRADVTPEMRVSFTPHRATTAKTFEIHGVQSNAGRPEWLRLTCSEVL